MSKLLLFLSFSSLVILAVGTSIMPNNQMFLLAGSSASFQYLREVLAAILFIQLVTHPPRHIIFRLLAGGTAILVAVWAIFATYNGVMLFLDTLSLLAAAAAIGVTALEVKPAQKYESHKSHSSNPLIA